MLRGLWAVALVALVGCADGGRSGPQHAEAAAGAATPAAQGSAVESAASGALDPSAGGLSGAAEGPASASTAEPSAGGGDGEAVYDAPVADGALYSDEGPSSGRWVQPAPLSTCPATQTGYGFAAIKATRIDDPAAAPVALIDGCSDQRQGWSGASGTVLTLDAGAIHQMQGLYIWAVGSRSQALRVQTSNDEQRWRTAFAAAPIRAVDGPLYYPFDRPGSVRFVRLTVLAGADAHVAELRWSATGWPVEVERIWRAEDIGSRALSMQRHADASAVAAYLDILAALAEAPGCGDPSRALVWVDATGLRSRFIGPSAAGQVWSVDWQHLPAQGVVETLLQGLHEVRRALGDRRCDAMSEYEDRVRALAAARARAALAGADYRDWRGM